MKKKKSLAKTRFLAKDFCIDLFFPPAKAGGNSKKTSNLLILGKNFAPWCLCGKSQLQILIQLSL